MKKTAPDTYTWGQVNGGLFTFTNNVNDMIYHFGKGKLLTILEAIFPDTKSSQFRAFKGLVADTLDEMQKRAWDMFEMNRAPQPGAELEYVNWPGIWLYTEDGQYIGPNGPVTPPPPQTEED